jgi:citrate synthase
MASLGGQEAPGPSVDLALVALARGLGWPSGAATAVFAAARMAGWIAHVFEQRASKDLLRPRARFTGKVASAANARGARA